MVASSSRYTVEVFSATREGDEFVIRTEYLPNGSLASRCEQGTVPMKDFYTWFPAICRGVSFLHSKGILHRDIKPANVLFDKDLNARLCDFGLALLEGTQPDHASMAYLPTLTPESDSVATKAGDIYALGCLAYRMLFGEIEWKRQLRDSARGEKPLASLKKAAREGNFPNRTSFPPNVSKRLQRVLLRALDPNPAKRFTSVTELCEAVESAIPPVYWSLDTDNVGWVGESKMTNDNRIWRVRLSEGHIETKRSINGSQFRRVSKFCAPIGNLSDHRVLSEAFRNIENSVAK